MIDRADVEETIYRVAVAALIFYPEKPQTEAGYQLGEDLDWCMAPLAHAPTEVLPALRLLVGRAIIDPTKHRRALITELAALTDE